MTRVAHDWVAPFWRRPRQNERSPPFATDNMCWNIERQLTFRYWRQDGQLSIPGGTNAILPYWLSECQLPVRDPVRIQTRQQGLAGRV